VDTKNNFPEFSDEWVFVPEKNTSLENQVIFSYKGFKLINVRKIYTNGVYWGVMQTTITDEGEIVHGFRCKDRGFSEEIVDDKKAFISLYKDDIAISVTKILNRSKFKTIKPDFLQEYQVAFVLHENGAYHATTAVIDNCAPTRGIYGATTQEVYEEFVKEFGFSVLNRFPTEEEVKLHLIDKQINALSANFITRENTAYSNIKIYHKSEVNNGTQTTTKITS